MDQNQEGKPRNGRRIIFVSGEFIRYFFMPTELGTAYRVIAGLPKDARLLRCGGPDFERGAYYLIFESAEWTPTPDCEILQTVNVSFEKVRL